MSIFGISLLDNFGLSFLDNLIKELKNISVNTIDYLSNTKFYNYLTSLFEKEITSSEISNKSRPLITENSSETIRNESSIRQNNRNSKISE
jgi:hypothetical protein